MDDLSVHDLLRGVRLDARWGGRREGAGRKPVSELTARGEYMGFAITSQQWVEFFKRLYELAMSDEPSALRAAGLLLRYRFGSGAFETEVDDVDTGAQTRRAFEKSELARTRRSRAVQPKLPAPPVEDSGIDSAGNLE